MNKRSQTALNVLAIVVGMFGMAYASVPLYYAFCKVTGLGGTTQEAKVAPDHIIDRHIRVLLNTDVDGALDWQFTKLQDKVDVRVGEEKLIYFEAQNVSNQTLVGMANYNVQPSKMGEYFVKLKCFCFEQQVLKPGQKVTFPVSFFIDPSIMDDKNLDDVKDVVLSYTFYKYKDQNINKLGTENGK